MEHASRTFEKNHNVFFPFRYMLSADTKADKVTWLNTINDSLKDWRAWHKNVAK
jgi:hypothetical protein